MAGEKYIVAAAGNPVQIAIRNTLNPCGFLFLGNCSDSVSLMRLVRSYHPDFIIADMSLQLRELKQTLETIEDEMLCACILTGDYKDLEISNLLEKSKILSFCPKPLSRELLLHCVDMSIISYKRVAELDKKLKEVTESFETRKLVERAKWILMERDRIGEAEAYDRMRRKSMDSRISMKEIASAVIQMHEIIGTKQ